MKRILIISPHFPPVNAPDMQRVRMSLPYYKALGWEPVVICVHQKFVSGFKDALLEETVPTDIEIHRVGAWPDKLTRKFGLGSLSLRSYYQFKKVGNKLLATQKFDLIFFSTTLFHVCALGRYWQKKFGVPFVIDMQDPWRNDFFLSKPRSQRPPKFRFAHAVNKRLEAFTIPYAAGIMSVSQAYIDALIKRYPELHSKPALLLPFGASLKDFEFVKERRIVPLVVRSAKKINVVYAGAANAFFLPLIRAFFIAFKNGVANSESYHFYFIGTNYVHSRRKPIEEMAGELGIRHLVTEEPKRIPYFSALSTLLHADILFIPGSSDAGYNASKVYNNIFSGRPIFSIFNEKSLVINAINEANAGIAVPVKATDSEEALVQKIAQVMPQFTQLHLRDDEHNEKRMKNYTASYLAGQQAIFFNKVIQSF